jgi:D-alanyl-D-alanine carboxypeptidase
MPVRDPIVRVLLAQVTAISAIACHDGAGEPDLADRQAVQSALDALTASGQAPGALARIGDESGSVTLRSGRAELGGEAPMVGEDGRFRIGSITKSFVAVAVLGLVEEGRVALDDPIDAYLPGVVHGTGAGAAIDGRDITVRQLLQHTSGLPDFLDHVPPDPERPVAPADQIARALEHEPEFSPPGSAWAYCNTGYLVLGMLVESVTGQDIASVLGERIIEPLGLTATYWPPDGERALRGPHAHNYLAAMPGGDLLDVTELEPSMAGAAGQLVSTPADLDRFWRALFGDELLEPALREEMTVTVPRTAGGPPDDGYGLGLFRVPLSCGGSYLGHTGDHLGVHARSGRDQNGRQVTVYITQRESDESSAQVSSIVDMALCSGR